MALQEVTQAFFRRARPISAPSASIWRLPCRRHASSESASPAQDDEAELEASSFVLDNTVAQTNYDPVKRQKWRNKELPSSRYSFRPPRYDRGPLHPHQSPAPSDPASREFIPGPFSLPRLEQTYNDTFASDLMTAMYTHFPPGYEAAPKGPRLRPWVGDNPYFKNRPLRGPRGGDTLRLLRKPITFRNVPKLERVTVHSMIKEAKDNSAPLHVAGMALQAITGARATSHAVRKPIAGFGIRQGQYLSLTCELRGEAMYHFLSKTVDVVLPKVKDWRGVKGSSGDSSGNLAFGLTGEQVALFPEIEVNYDMYPPKMIPGCHIVIHTSAREDRVARMLLRSIGLPFYGKLVD